MKIIDTIKTSFENYDAQIKEYLNKVFGQQNYSLSQIFGLIFTAIKNVMQNIMFYIEDAFTEQNIDTAYRKSSIYSLAKISGYEPYYGSAANGILEIEVKMNNSSSNKLYIKNGSSIIDNNSGNTYCINSENDYTIIDLSKPGFKTYVKIVNGTWRTASYISIGEPLEAININTNGLFDKEFVQVRVDGELYEPVSNIYDMNENSKEYVIKTGYDNELDIIFGNGIHGKQLEEGQSISIKYLIHNGENGNVSKTSDYDFTFKDPVYDSFGNATTETEMLNINLYSDITGGVDADDIKIVKEMIGYNSRNLIIASEQNFKMFLKRFSFVGQSNIWCNNLNVNLICTNNFKNSDQNTYLDAFDNNNLILNDEQKNMIAHTLENSNKAYAGIKLNFVDPIIRRYALYVFIKCADSYDRKNITEILKQTITEYFVQLPDNTDFISKSSIINNILNSIKDFEINSIDINIISDSNENAKYQGYYYKYINDNNNNIIKEKYFYDSFKPVGLDEFGNIQIDSMFEIPVLSNNVTYFIEDGKTIKIPAIQIFFS